MVVKSRLLLPLAVGVAVVVAVDAALGQVGWGWSGRRLLLAAVSLAYLAAVVLLLTRPLARGAGPAVLAIIGACAVGIVAVDPAGSPVGIMLVGALAPLLPERRVAAAIAAAAAVVFAAVQIADGGDSAPVALATVAGVLFFFLVGRLLRREQEQRRRADQLLAELERSREAERRAWVEAERARTAREIHDVLAHTLSGLSIQLQATALLAERDGAGPALEQAVDRAQHLARAGLLEARRAVAALRGAPAPGAEGIPDLVEQHRLAAAGPVRLAVEGEPVPLPAEVGLALYRTTQEALSNARKHAPGAPVHVALRWQPDRVVLVVENDLAEPNVVVRGEGYGLTGMTERATLAGGEVRVTPGPDRFRVRLEIPLTGDVEDAERFTSLQSSG